MSIFSAPAPGFYGAADKAIYDQGFSFIPQEMYRGAFVAPTFPTAPTTTTSGVTTVPRTTALDIGRSRDDNNPFNPNMDQIRTDFNPRPFNLAMRNTEEFGSTVGPNPDLFFAPQSKIGGIIDLIPGIGGIKRAANIIGNMLPINQRAILENEARGAGIFTDDIGRIVGDPNTAQGIMAGYNLNKITRDTFNKRRSTIQKAIDKKLARGEDISGLQEKLGLLDESEEDMFGSVSTPDFIGPFTQGGIFGRKAIITKMRKDQKEAEEEKARLEKEAKLKEEIRLANLKAAQDAAKKRADEAKAKQLADAAERARLENLSRYKDRGGFDIAGATQASIRASREDRSGRGQRGGFTNPGRGSYGPFMADGGRVYYMDGGLTDLVDIYD